MQINTDDIKKLAVKITNNYIGVYEGYLRGFSYSSHYDFYPQYCDIIKNTYSYSGTTRQKFQDIFISSTSEEKAKIIEGVIEYCPVGANGAPQTRTESLKNELLSTARILKTSFISIEESYFKPKENLARLLDDANSRKDPINSVDRFHAFFCGYLKEKCKDKGIEFDKRTKTDFMLKELLDKYDNDIKKVDTILKALISIVNKLDEIRNNNTLAHPNENFLGKEEAILVINTILTIYKYLDAKLILNENLDREQFLKGGLQ